MRKTTLKCIKYNRSIVREELLFKNYAMYKYLFGPVPSRRLGMSLGIDLVPKKVCSLDCIYCEVGATTKLTLDKKEYVLFDKIKEELTHYFRNNPDPDFFTFSGSGEPTLNSKIKPILEYIKEIKPDIPVAVLTNGTLLFDPEVRNALVRADVVLPSLDAASQEVFEKINRPVKGIAIDQYIEGIVAFRKVFKGKMWLEVLILPDYNDSEEEIMALKKAIERIKPDAVQLNTLDRPGTVPGLRGASLYELERIVERWHLDNVSIISAAVERKKNKSYRSDIRMAILETISRRPCTLDDLTSILGLHVNEINKYLDVLDSEEEIEVIQEKRGVFYQLKNK